MSPRISRIYPLLLALCLLLPSCTLLDNDLRPESEKQEAAPDTTNYIHEQTDEYTASYQYSDQTRVLDEQFLSYVAGIDYSLGTLYLEDFTPDALLPVAGQILAGPICNQLPYGLAHHVVSVTHQNTLYEVRIKRAYIDEVFSHLELEGEFAALSDSLIEDSMDLGNGVKVTRAVANENKDLGGEERSATINLQVDASGAIAKSIPGLSLTGSGGLTFTVAWKPINKVFVYANTDTSVLDMRLTGGATYSITITVNGAFGLSFDLFEYLKIKDILKKIFHFPIGATIGLPIFLDLYPTFVLALENSYSLGLRIQKTFYTDIKAAYGVKGKSNGLDFKNHNQELEFEDLMEDPHDGTEGYAATKASVSLKMGLTADLYFGAPTDAPKVGVKAEVSCGPRVMFQDDTDNEGYNRCWHFGFPLTIDGKLYFSLFKKIDALEWNFVDFLARKFGSKNGSEFWEFGKQDFRFFPSIDNMRILCTNNLESGSVPTFSVDFDVLTNGSKTASSKFRPYYRIYPHNVSAASPIVTLQPHQLTSFRQGLHFNTTINNSALQRDEIYDLEVVLVKEWLDREILLYTRRFPFTSTSPTAFINEWKKTAQWEHQSKQMRNGGYTCYYDYDFVTYVHFEGRDLIKKWGFIVDGQKYNMDTKPAKDDVAVKWSIEKSKKSKRSLKIIPYIIYELDGKETLAEMAPYTVSLTYDKSLNTVKNEWEGRKYRDDKDYDDYVRSGFDINGEVTTDLDFQTK